MKTGVLRGLGMLLLGLPLQAADEAPAERDYVRFVEDETSSRLETAVHTFTNAAGVRVDLVGAVHIADKAYFESLNERFKGYEAVLFELVGGPESLKAKRGGQAAEGGGNLAWVGMFQQWLQTKLGLSFQLQEVDYEATNFVHADMDVEGFLATQEEKKENFLGLWLKAAKAQAELAKDQPSGKKQPGLAQILEWMMSDDSEGELKRVIGREFDSVENLMAGIEGDGGTVIIGERNRVVVEVLKKEMAAGKTKLAVFYGAAHLPDLEDKLEAQGFRPGPVEWETAWDIPAAEDGDNAKN